MPRDSRARSAASVPDEASALASRDGTCAAGHGLVTTFDDPGVVRRVDDPDSFDDADCSLYALDPQDDDHMHMIELSLNETCDCGNRIFARNKCTNCGAQAPWASQLGCGLA